MNVEWHIWYGLRIGLTYQQAWCIPFGELCDLIAIEQVKTEGAKLKKSKAEEESDFWRLMSYK